MNRITLIIPGLRWPHQAFQDLTFDLDLPGLSRLLSAGRLIDQTPADPVVHAACTGITAGAAALRLLGLGGSPGPDRWLCLDPVRIILRERDVHLSAGSALGLDADQATHLAATLAADFAALGQLFATAPTAWHLRLHQGTPAPGLTPLPSALGNNSALISLSPEPAWRNALNSAQMQLHQHAADDPNLARVNSVWPWGDGRLPPAKSSTLQWLLAENPVLRGWGRHCGLDCGVVPSGFRTWPAGDGLIVLDQLEAPERAADALAWRAAVQRLDQDWLQPLADSGQAASVLFPGGTGPRCLDLPPDSIWRRLRNRLRRPATQAEILQRLAQ